MHATGGLSTSRQNLTKIRKVSSFKIMYVNRIRLGASNDFAAFNVVAVCSQCMRYRVVWNLHQSKTNFVTVIILTPTKYNNHCCRSHALYMTLSIPCMVTLLYHYSACDVVTLQLKYSLILLLRPPVHVTVLHIKPQKLSRK